MKALEKNGTWEIYERGGVNNSVECRWIYTLKHQSDDTLDHYKTILVGKG